MKKVCILLPYIGVMDQYKLLAAVQLSKVEGVVLKIITNEPNAYVINNEYLEILDIREMFNLHNSFNIDLDLILSNPYKLCDYKPFYDDLFKDAMQEYGISYNFWGWADVDCLYNVKTLSKVVNYIDDVNAIYGDRGHLTICGKVASDKYQKLFLQKAIEYKSAHGIELINTVRHFALDEFLFLHKLLSSLDKKGVIVWRQNYFDYVYDVDYKNLLPNNFLPGLIYINDSSIMVDGCSNKVTYIHLQKRKIKGVALESLADGFYLSFDSYTGEAIYSLDVLANHKPSRLRSFTFSVRSFINRAKVRFKNHKLSRKPRFRAC